MFDLLLQKAQHFAQTQGELTFSLGNGIRGFELIGLGKDGQTLLSGFRSPKLVSVQEFLPTALARFDQDWGSGKLNDEVPSKGAGPIVKGFERSRIVFNQSLLKFVDQEGALLNQAAFILAQEAQVLGQWIHRLKGLPAVAVHAQGVSQAPSIEVIGLGAAGSFAFTVTF